MIFKELPLEKRIQLHEETLSYANSIGGINFFLQMIEDIKKEKPNPLLNKSNAYNFSKGRLNWEKQIFKDTLTLLFNSMRKEEKDGDMIAGLNPKEYRACMNMMRTLRPIKLYVRPRKEEDGEGFSFPILDTSIDKKTKVTTIFKMIFFYNTDFAKEVLNYKKEEA